MSHQYLYHISLWAQQQKMMLNPLKSKTMIFNFTQNYKFTTRLPLEGQNLEVVSSTKLLGTIISKDLKWDKNINSIIKKAYARMQLIKKIICFNPPKEDLITIYISFIRSLLEQSCVVWNSMLTEQNINDLERVHKTVLKLILKNEYLDYNNALLKLDLPTLSQRRKYLCENFALKNINNEKMKHHFRENPNLHNMTTKNPEKYMVSFAHTERLKNSPVIYMQKLLNQKHMEIC